VVVDTHAMETLLLAVAQLHLVQELRKELHF
jgi:hypothetical protein